MRDSAASVIKRFASARVLVLGDLVLDEYIVGRASRLSREAPIPVLDFDERFVLPGAASNPAANVAALGAAARLVGVVGQDDAARQLADRLASMGIADRSIVASATRETSIKTRILARVSSAHRQQLARVDRVDRTPLDADDLRAAVAALGREAPECDVILVSDYKGGVVNGTTLDAVRELASRFGRDVVVDSQGDLAQFGGCALVKCNQTEAEATLRRGLTTDDDFAVAGRELQATLGARHVVITRGGDGMSVLDEQGQHHRLLAANHTEVWDVTGAGDTVIAVLALGIAVGADLHTSARIANAAAGIVVRRLGVATVGPDELIAASA
jgi:rfaE bifunctional protein kinase chain/domain